MTKEESKQQSRKDRLKRLNLAANPRIAALPPHLLVTDYLKDRITIPSGQGSYKYWIETKAEIKALRKLSGTVGDPALLRAEDLADDKSRAQGMVLITNNVVEGPRAVARHVRIDSKEPKKSLLSADLNEEIASREFYDAEILNDLFGGQHDKVPPIFMTLSDFAGVYKDGHPEAGKKKHPEKADRIKFAPAMQKMSGQALNSGAAIDKDQLGKDLVVNALIGNLDTHGANALVNDDKKLCWVDVSDPNIRKHESLLSLFAPFSAAIEDVVTDGALGEKVTKKRVILTKYVGAQNYHDLKGFVTVNHFLAAYEEIKKLGLLDEKSPARQNLLDKALRLGGAENAADLAVKLEELNQLGKFLENEVAKAPDRVTRDTPMMQVASSIMLNIGGDLLVNDATYNLDGKDGVDESEALKAIRNFAKFKGLMKDFLKQIDPSNPVVLNQYGTNYDQVEKDDDGDLTTFAKTTYDIHLDKIKARDQEITAEKQQALAAANRVLQNVEKFPDGKKPQKHTFEAISGYVVDLTLDGAAGPQKYFLATDLYEGQAEATTQIYDIFTISDDLKTCGFVSDYEAVGQALNARLQELSTEIDVSDEESEEEIEEISEKDEEKTEEEIVEESEEVEEPATYHDIEEEKKPNPEDSTHEFPPLQKLEELGKDENRKNALIAVGMNALEYASKRNFHLGEKDSNDNLINDLDDDGNVIDIREKIPGRDGKLDKNPAHLSVVLHANNVVQNLFSSSFLEEYQELKKSEDAKSKNKIDELAIEVAKFLAAKDRELEKKGILPYEKKDQTRTPSKKYDEEKLNLIQSELKSTPGSSVSNAEGKILSIEFFKSQLKN
jgi:hypothetical protein